MSKADFLKNEKDLVVRLIDGDEKAFCELYATYKNRLLYFAMQFVKSREYAEDIFQDTFTIIWQGRQFINPETSFSSYLHTIIRNRVLNELRYIEKNEKLRNHILAQAVDYSNESKNQILFNELKELLSRAKEQLTPRQREIFQMSRESEMSHKEIAEALNISVYTVQEHISSSLKVIRNYLQAHFSKEYLDILILIACLNL